MLISGMQHIIEFYEWCGKLKRTAIYIMLMYLLSLVLSFYFGIICLFGYSHWKNEPHHFQNEELMLDGMIKANVSGAFMTDRNILSSCDMSYIHNHYCDHLFGLFQKKLPYFFVKSQTLEYQARPQKFFFGEGGLSAFDGCLS